MQSHINWQEKIIEPSGASLSPVKEATIYPDQTADFLRDQMQGKTVAEAARDLGVNVSELANILEGKWKPSKLVCKRLGLEVVYAIANGASPRSGAK